MTQSTSLRKTGERTVRLRGVSPDGQGATLTRTRAHRHLNNLELVEHLCVASATLAAARRQHVRVFGSIMPHVFMANVLARVHACLKGALRPEAVAILAVLEMASESADIETRDVIAASFVREAKRQGFFADLKPLIGHRLAALKSA